MKNVYCSIFGHQYVISKHVTDTVKEYKCKNCDKQVTTNSNGELTLLTKKYKDINSTLERIHKCRKQRRLNKKQPISA